MCTLTKRVTRRSTLSVSHSDEDSIWIHVECSETIPYYCLCMFYCRYYSDVNPDFTLCRCSITYYGVIEPYFSDG